ncbi:MAG: UDP-N-acetylmuramoyl-tripeptide--D-alanyl-D-alanine ligase [bacterium]|nr:UDP-N-acetylmuramoyl-tripeptide--D-alanyl-D-alanine ligase [bacterium]
MQSLALAVLVLIWLGGTLVRIYRQARFYQIEEYMPLRYLRWTLAKRERILPQRTIVAGFLAAVLAFFLSEAPGSILPAVVAATASLVAVWPPDEGEIKKRFNRTPRATRLLGAAFFTAVVLMAIGLWIVAALGLDAIEFQVIGVLVVGLVNYLFAPLHLIAGNTLMTPVEAFLRQRFINQARAVLAQIQPRVVGITGSYGKTTTKHFLSEILNGRYKTYPTPKSYNTMMGVCIAINKDLANDFSIEYFIVEMGAYIRGEIQRIAGLTPPDISIVVEVGPQHLERFGSLENIAIAKYEIIKALRPDGVGVFNWDNPYVRDMYERGYPQTRLAVSKSIAPEDAPADGPRFIASNVHESLDGLQFTVTDRETGAVERFEAPLVGEHNVTNILLATAVAVHEGMSLREVAVRVRRLRPAESRLVRQTTPQGITIINDAYSANPAGVVSALKVLGMHTGGKRLVITPGMVELGDLHEPENRKLGQRIPDYATDVILVGEEQTRPIQQGLADKGFPAERLRVVEELREAVRWYQANLKPGDTVLFLNDLPDTY